MAEGRNPTRRDVARLGTTGKRPTGKLPLERVMEHAFASLTRQQRASTNLYVDEQAYRSGARIGPPRQGIMARRPSLLVFADDEPRANFAHTCRYLLYDSKSGELDRIVSAVFPPFVKAPPPTLKPFHQPVQFLNDSLLFRPTLRLSPCLRRSIVGARYAILYSGMSEKRHLNDLEFLYRVLVDIYAFDPANIYALSYDGTLDTQDGVQQKWPGDNTNYRIKLTGNGTRGAFEGAVDNLKTRIKRDDLLLIHTNNHGGHHPQLGSDLCTYPNWEPYYATDFANKLAELPNFRKLIVMMEQCYSGGFNNPIILKSKADATSVASAAAETNKSYFSDDNWDTFAREWISAQAGVTPCGQCLQFDPDSNSDGMITAAEAFLFAQVLQDPRDSPNFSQSSAAGGAIALGEEFAPVPWWCDLVAVELEPWRRRVPPEELYARLRRFEPQLRRIGDAVQDQSEAIETQFVPQVRAILKEAFGQFPPSVTRS